MNVLDVNIFAIWKNGTFAGKIVQCSHVNMHQNLTGMYCAIQEIIADFRVKGGLTQV